MNKVQTLEVTFPTILNEQTFQKWISVKQVTFFISLFNLQLSRKIKQDGTNKKVYVGNVEKYQIELYVSPLNQAGSIKIVNNEIVNDNIKQVRILEIEKFKNELEDHKKTLNHMIVNNYGNEGIEKLYKDMVLGHIERLESNLQMLGVKL